MHLNDVFQVEPVPSSKRDDFLQEHQLETFLVVAPTNSPLYVRENERR